MSAPISTTRSSSTWPGGCCSRSRRTASADLGIRSDSSVAASGGSRRSPDAGAGVRWPEVDSLLEQFQEGFGGERGDGLAPDVHHRTEHEGALPGVEELSVTESVGAAVGSAGILVRRHDTAAKLVYLPGEAVIDPLVDEIGRVQLRVVARV